MAESKVVLDLKIEAAESAKTLGEIRKSLKALIDEQANVAVGSKEWKKLNNAINETEGKIGDLTDSFRTLQGSGVDRVQSSFGLFKEGLMSFDFGKIGTSLKGLGAAFKAIPIFLVVEGVMKLIENFDKLKDSGGIIGKIFRGIGEVIDWVSDKLERFGDWISGIDTDVKKLAETQIETAKKTKEAVADRYEREMALASAAGKKTTELEAQKARDVRKRIDEEMNAILKLGQINGTLTEEQKKQLASLGEERKKTILDEEVARAKGYKDLVDSIQKAQDEQQKKAKESSDKAKQEREKRIADSKAEADALFTELSKNQDAIDAHNKAAREREKKDKEEQAKYEAETDAAWKKWAAEENKKVQDKYEADTKASNQAIDDAKVKGLQAGQALSEAFFAIQLNRAKGNAARELEIRKQMFNVDKAFNVARATQDGIRSVQAALTIPPPGGQILAGVNAALAVANVAKILATKFDGGGASVTAETGSVSVPTNTSLPTVSNTTAPNIQPSTSFDETGRNLNNRVYVLESDITKSQGRVARLNEQATI